MTVGEDEQLSPQSSALCLKIFDLDKTQQEGPSTSTPECVQILRIFTNQFPEAKVFMSVVELKCTETFTHIFALLRVH